MLDGYQYTQPRLNRCFNLSCQHKLGGFGKDQGAYPDLLHAYFGVCGLALCGLDGLQPIDVTLGLSVKVCHNTHHILCYILVVLHLLSHLVV